MLDETNDPTELAESRCGPRVLTEDVFSARHVAGRFRYDMEGALRIAGTVIRGEGRSGEFGYPTANVLIPPSIILPPDGVYAGWLHHSNGAGLPGVIYIGKHPMLRGKTRRHDVKVHVIDWSGSLLRKKVSIQFFAYLRDELRFKSGGLLAKQMKMDCGAVRAWLG